MSETLISSTALILAICVIRQLLNGRISPKIRYSLWGLAALRLMAVWFLPLLPLIKRIPSSRFSVMNAAESFREQVIVGTDLELLADNIATGHVYGFDQPVSMVKRAAGIDWQLILFVIWGIGVVVFVGVMAQCNRNFYRRLVRDRKPYPEKTPAFVTKPVYTVSDLGTPCYFGVGNDEAIYIPEAIVHDEKQVLHALAHESGHAAQGDLHWGRLRCILLSMYWFDPFVWLAAVLSKRDCELSCDLIAVRFLGEEERFSYGRTLVGMIPAKGEMKELFCASTAMAAGKRAMKERVRILAKHPKTTAVGMVILGMSVVLLGACTFTGKLKDTSSGAAAGTELSVEQTESQSFEQDTSAETPESAASQPVPGSDSGLTLVSSRQVGLFHTLTLEWEKPTAGIPTESLLADITVTVCSDTDGNVPIDDGTPKTGYWTNKEGNSYNLTLCNIENAASFRIRIKEPEGQTGELIYRPKELPAAVEHSVQQTIRGMDGNSVILESVAEYPNTLVLNLKGDTAQRMQDFHSANVLLLNMENEDGTTEQTGPAASVNGSSSTVQLIYSFPDRTDAMADIVSLSAGMGRREEYAETPFEYHAILEAACVHVRGEMEKGQIPETALSDIKKHLVIQWKPEQKEVYAAAAYRFRETEDSDSYTYLNMELKKAWDAWSVSWSGLEK